MERVGAGILEVSVSETGSETAASEASATEGGVDTKIGAESAKIQPVNAASAVNDVTAGGVGGAGTAQDVLQDASASKDADDSQHPHPCSLEISKLVGVDYVYLSSKPIFDGANGIIYRGTDTNKSTVLVIKTVRIQKDQLLDIYRRSVVREFENLKRCAASKQVVTIVDLAANSHSLELSLIVKHYPNGDLLDCLCELRSKKIELNGNLKNAIFKQIVRGVDFLHRHDIAHRDIKPENFLIDESGIIKLNDFGYSLDVTKMDDQLPLNDLSCGTLSFKAPELYQIERSVSENPRYDARGVDFKMVDIWALGILAFQLFLMSKPWQHANVVTDSKNVVVEKYIKHYPDNEKQLINLVNKLNDRNHGVSSNPALSLFKKLHYDARTLALEMLHPVPEKRCTTGKLLLSNWLIQAYADPKDLLKMMLK